MKKRRQTSARLIALGLLIILVGFVYDVLFAGIPYQDPTPVMLASYNFHAKVASIIRWSGAAICIISALALFIQPLIIKLHNPKNQFQK